jgi:general secretion pathway protein M
MRALPTGARGQALAAGIALLGILAFWLTAIDPAVRLYAERSDRLAARTAVADRMERLAAQKASFEARAGQFDGAGPGRPLLDGRTDAVAAAELQNVMQDIANSVGVSLTSVESLPAEAASGSARRIGIKLSFSAPWPVLIGFLDATGRAATPVLLDDLHLHSQPGMQNGQQMLDAGFNVYAYAASAGHSAP